MTTFFLRKKLISIISIIFSLIFVMLSLVYAGFMTQVKVLEFQTTFYFLVSETLSVEASTEFIKLEGGAGYLLEYGGREYIILSVYTNEEEGESVCSALSTMGRQVKLLPISIYRLYFKGKQKQSVSMYVSALKSIKEYIFILHQCIILLDNGATQEGIKRILTPVQKHFARQSCLFQDKYTEYANLCDCVGEELQQINQTVFARDLRYLTCGMVDGFFKLCKQFEL